MKIWDAIKEVWEKEKEEVREYTSEQIEAVTDYRRRKVAAAQSWRERAQHWLAENSLKVFIFMLGVIGIFFMVAAHADDVMKQFNRHQRVLTEAAVYQMMIPGVSTCSAVLVAPDTLLTAAHCKGADGFIDDNGTLRRIIRSTILESAPDTMVVVVKGMDCLPPHHCVPVLPKHKIKMEDRARIVGYPYGLGVASSPAKIIEWATILVPRVTDEQGAVFLLVHSLMPVHGGMSGGGVFTVQDDVVYLVGVITGGQNAMDGKGANVAVSVLP